MRLTIEERIWFLKKEISENLQANLIAYLDGIQSALPEGSEDVIDGVCEIIVDTVKEL